MSGANDNFEGGLPIASPPAIGAHGELALLLLESLIHVLVARSVLTIKEALEAVQTAIDVQIAISSERGDSPHSVERLLEPLSAIFASLKIDDR